jgi:FkbM family methyltransferase
MSKPTKTVEQHNGTVVTFFTENHNWVRAFDAGNYAWEKTNMAYMRKLVPNPDVVLDIGANIGQETLMYAKVANQVVSFEPIPNIFQVLSQNITQNSLTNVTAYQKAVYNAPGVAKMNSPKGNEGASHLTQKQDGKNQFEVELIVIDDLILPEGRVDFVKIDVEGFEMKVLEGMRGTIEKFSPVFQIELHDELLIRDGTDSTQIWDFFNERGYTASLNTGESLPRERAPTKNRSRVDVFFKREGFDTTSIFNAP